MKKDIDFHIAEHVQIVAVREWDEDFLAQHWNVYIVNNASVGVETVLVVSRGSSNEQKTSILRHNMGDLQAHSAKKIEFMQDAVLRFENEYMVTYFSEDKLHDKRFVFAPDQISEESCVPIRVLETEGVLAS